MLQLTQFHYNLSDDLIAQAPISPRDHSRLLVVNRHTGTIEHRHFYDLPALLHPGDVIVRNNTKVIPARIYGQKDTGGHIEMLLVRRLQGTENGELWECLSKPGLKLHQEVFFPETGLHGICRTADGFARQVEFNQRGEQLFNSLFRIGHTPLPPYIQWNTNDEQELRELYQTTYAKIAGSAAAPTAGLHFTAELDQKLRAMGVQIEEVTLHVGLGTFLRVLTTDIIDHTMHYEWYTLTEETAQRLNQARAENRRIITVGTTTTRVLETCSNEHGQLTANSSETNIFIYPGYRFKFVKDLLTNFHESRSTLLMLISALVSVPNTSHEFTSFTESVAGKAYQAAIAEKYRFHSFGDAMWIKS